MRNDDNEEPICGSLMKKTYNDTQCGRCGLIGHNSRGCVQQGVDRRPKDRNDTENVGNDVPGNAENVVAENARHVEENVINVNAKRVVDGNVANARNAVNFVANKVVTRHV